MPAEEDRKGERRDGDDGMPETLLPLFVLLVKQQKRASIYLAGFLEPMTKKKLAKDVSTTEEVVLGFSKKIEQQSGDS